MAFAGPPLPTAPVNTTTADEQTHADVVGLAGGGHVVIWTSTGQDGSSAGLYSQAFDANGIATGVETRVNTTTADSQDFADAAALTAGGYVVTWTSNAQDGDLGGIYLQRYDAAGAPVGGETLVNTQTAGSQDAPQVLGLSTGGFAIVWSDSNTPLSVRMQFYDAVGGAVGSEIIVATPPANHAAVSPRLTEMASGRIAVTWSDAAFGSLSDDPYFQLVKSDGTLFGGPVQMNTTPGTLANQTQVAALPGGGFMAVWTESIGATGAVGVGDARIVGRIYNNSGVAQTGEFTISDAVTHLRFDPAVTLGGDGNVYVGWIEQTGNGEVYVMRGVSQTGTLQGDQFFLTDVVPNAGLNRFLDLTTLANGNVVATWQSWFGTSDIVTRTVYTDQSDPRVTGNADTVALGAGGEVLDALGGGDSITGGSGDDVVFGNSGSDTLTGAGGYDFLNGGDSADTIDGGTYADVLLGGDGTDSMDGGGGADTIAGEDQSDTINGDAGNDEIQGGAGGDEISGSADDDVIWGDHNPFGVWTDGAGGNDTLYGGSGNDRVYGGSDDDVLDGGDGDDVLFGDDYTYDGLVTGDDLFILSIGRDTMNGVAGNDTIDGSAATAGLTVDLNPFGNGQGICSGAGGYDGTIYYVDNFFGSAFADDMTGDGDGNTFVGNNGDDLLDGGGGRDDLSGGRGADTLTGGTGDDTLDGGSSRDALNGNSGKDVFVFAAGYGKDTVSGYDQGSDSVVLDDALWIATGVRTAQEVLDDFGTLSGNAKKLTLDFGGGDVLILKGGVFDLLTLAGDISF